MACRKPLSSSAKTIRGWAGESHCSPHRQRSFGLPEPATRPNSGTTPRSPLYPCKDYFAKVLAYSIFYFGEWARRPLLMTALTRTGYLASQFPAGYVIQRLPLGKVIGTTTIIWGIILITTPACTNFAGMATNRFLLGFFEAVVNPGFVLIMSIW